MVEVSVLESEPLDISDVLHSPSLQITPLENYPDNSIQRLVPSNIYGDARWRTITEIRAAGLISDSGIPLGLFETENGEFKGGVPNLWMT